MRQALDDGRQRYHSTSRKPMKFLNSRFPLYSDLLFQEQRLLAPLGYLQESHQIAQIADVERTSLELHLGQRQVHQKDRTYTIPIRSDWKESNFLFQTNELIEDHCRNVKKGIIDDGREFFPSMFDYEFPTKTFRDCYFAYIPGKEEAVFSYRPWKVFEFIDYKLIRIKNAKKCRT